MSEVYKDAILSKKYLQKEKQNKIKIIGAVSTISIGIEDIINDDENIIRVYPPDYDEAKIAINFLMSKIKNNICHCKKCNFKSKKSNIILLHANEYGEAVKSRCKEFYEQEMKDIDKTTNTNLSTLELEECIKFYSFSYKNESFIYDFIEEDYFEKYMEMWKAEQSTNYFFIVGYEPNISNMLNTLNAKMGHKLKDFCFLFSSTISLDKWRMDVCETINKNHLQGELHYYLSTEFVTIQHPTGK